MIVLVGFMGAGKSTVGDLVADALDLAFCDSDAVIEARAGRSIMSMFEQDGEPAFRALEEEIVVGLLAEELGVVALGGGSLSSPRTRTALISSGATVVHLDVSTEVAKERVGADAARPVLAHPDLDSLAASRRDDYLQAATFTLKVDERSATDVAEEIVTLVSIPLARATTSEGRAYPVLVGRDILDVLPALPAVAGARSAIIVTQVDLSAQGTLVANQISSATTITTAGGEASKSLDAARMLWEEFAAAKVRRTDVVVAVGGGVVTDLAGFVASTYNRGISTVNVPTTLLGMVDAAIGGKTGVNLPEGKNLIGTFHDPSAVLCDLAYLDTLPEDEFVAGLAEVAKYGFIAEPRLLEILGGGLEAVRGSLEEIVTTSARIKCTVVSDDPHEMGAREVLNYGHTFAHAIELASGYGTVRHGEAVSLGMMAAAHLARALGRIDEATVELHRSALTAVGLPVNAPFDLGVLEEAWMRDKKFRREPRFVLLSEIGVAEPGVAAPREALAEALERLAG